MLMSFMNGSCPQSSCRPIHMGKIGKALAIQIGVEP
jgi:hypothetical protein